MVKDIAGHNIKFGFGLYFLGKAQKKWQTDLDGLLKGLVKYPIANMVDLMWYSAQCEAELDGKELAISKRDFITFLEQTNDYQDEEGYLATWSNQFVESVKGVFGIDAEQEIEEDVKKK